MKIEDLIGIDDEASLEFTVPKEAPLSVGMVVEIHGVSFQVNEWCEIENGNRVKAGRFFGPLPK